MAEFEPPFEIEPDMVPIQGFNPLFPHVSPPRQVMMGGNLAQANVITGATRKRQRSGLERQHAKATFMKKINYDAYVVAVIPRFTNMGYNPSDLVIIQDESGTLDCITLPKYHVLHQNYGFMFKLREEEIKKLRPRARVPKGTILATSPNVTEDGDYMPGAEINVATMNIPAIAEDGLVYSKTLADKIFQTTGIETRIINCGSTHYLINLNGTEKKYLPLPNIGDTIRPDAIIGALRPKDKFHDAVYMSKRKLLRPVYGMDDPIYGKAGAQIIDIKVYHNDQGKSSKLPDEMTEQLRKYHEAEKEYCRNVLEIVMKRNHKDKGMNYNPNLSDRLWILVYQCIAYLGHNLVDYGLWDRADADRLNVPRLWRGQPMDEWRIEVTFAYKTRAAIGPKSTNLHGSKGVNVAIWPDEDMPTDKFGNRADLIMAPLATINRSNPGGSHEMLVGAAGRDVIKRVRRRYGLPDMGVLTWDEVWKCIQSHPIELAREMYQYIIGFYKIVAEKVNYTKAVELYERNDGKWLEDLCHIILDGNDPKGMYITTPANSKRRMARVIRQLHASDEYRPEMSTVRYRAPNGELEDTVAEILIGPNYYLALEKTATDGSGTSITRLGHHGTPTRLTNADKHLRPARETGTKTDGEAELRNAAKSVGSAPLADMADMYNNPRLLRVIAQKVLTTDKPTNIDEIFDRDVHEIGGHRPIGYMEHMFLCSGKGLSRE